MPGVAAGWVDEHRLTLTMCQNATSNVALTAELDATGTSLRESRWEFPVRLVETVCSLLDRHGVVWALDRRLTPRTWAERLLDELPAPLGNLIASIVQDALVNLPVLGDHRSDTRDHLAVLRAALLDSDRKRWAASETNAPSDAPAGRRTNNGTPTLGYVTVDGNLHLVDGDPLDGAVALRRHVGPASVLLLPGTPLTVVSGPDGQWPSHLWGVGAEDATT